MANITICGMDVSLRNFGLSKGILDLDTGHFKLTDMLLIESKLDPRLKKVVRKNSEDLERARNLSQGTREFIRGVDLICVEIPVGSQTARAMASYGICIGILSNIDIPIIQVTPIEVKLAATNSKTATKQQMIDWAIDLYPDAPWLVRRVKGEVEIVAKNEHLADSIAAIHAGVKTDQFNNAKVFLNKGNQ